MSSSSFSALRIWAANALQAMRRHNIDCQAACDWKRKNKHCGYTDDPASECAECPLQWTIDIPEEPPV